VCNKKQWSDVIYVKKDTTMSKIRMFFCLLAATLLVSCDPENHQHPDVLVGNWVSVSNAKDAALNLTFDGDDVTVKNGSWDYRPFTSDVEWEYYMSRDSVLHISRTTYYDDDYDTESYVLDLSFSNSFNTLTLWYDPPFSSVRKYTFIRR